MKSVAQHVVVAIVALACIGTELSAQNARTPKKNSEIVLEEIQAARATNAYDLVQSLRPQWLRINDRQTIRTQSVETSYPTGGSGTAQVMAEPEIIVYVNNSKFGTRESLRDLPVTNLHSVEFVSPAKATMRWGSGHTHGVILVLTSPQQ